MASRQFNAELHPSKAMLLNGSIAAIFVLVGSFRGLLSFKGKGIPPEIS